MDNRTYEVPNHKVQLYFETSDRTHIYIDGQYITTGFIGYMKEEDNELYALPSGKENETILGLIKRKFNHYWFGCANIMEDLLEFYDEKTADLINEKFNEIVCEYEYPDNFRFCLVGDDKQMKEYIRRGRDGCCGFYDEEVVIEGKKYKIGFNYGH